MPSAVTVQTPNYWTAKEFLTLFFTLSYYNIKSKITLIWKSSYHIDMYHCYPIK